MLYKEPIQICGRIIQNRIVMPPMATGKAVDGAPGEEMVEYYRQRAKGTGLVIVEHEYVMLQGMAHPGQLSMAEDPVIPAYRDLTNAIHGEGSAVIAQLNHAGVKAMDTGMPPAGPSVMPAKDGMAEAMDRDQIRAVIEAFTAAAVRAKEAGFDGAELHSAHGYLLNQFYSPLMNHRDDEYSAKSMADRTRLHCEIIRTVREAVGELFIIAIRFGACDFEEGGSRIEDIPEAVKAFEAAGTDLIDISGGTTGFMRPGHTEPGYLKDLSFAAKTAVSVPVILTGGVTEARGMENLLQEGAADLIGVGRALLKDPMWSLKALGEEERF